MLTLGYPERVIRCASIAIAVVAAAAALAGCGVSPGATGGVELTITRDFGAQPLTELPTPKGGGTVLALLQRNVSVQTGSDGAVQSVDGHRGDWFVYVNGFEATKSAARAALNSGDHVWWDSHDAGVATRIPAVVGSFPEPFVHGSGGRKLPVVVECSDPSGPACATVATTLSNGGVPVARGGLLLAAGSTELRVLVGDWAALRNDRAAAQLERGPQTSGVFARISGDGKSLTVFDQRGSAARTLRAHSGLIAATRYRSDQPVWVITGTDSVGITSAARALDPGALHDRFALAIAPDDTGIALPQVSR